MTSENATTLAEAVGHRFDSIFADEDDPTPTQASMVDTVTITSFQSPIIDLKSIIMSIEWEITERLMDRLHQEVNDLTALYHDKPIPAQFLKIMDVLGKYISHRKSDAHPDSIKLMSLAFNNFEAVVVNTDMPKAKKQELLQTTVRDFKRLKQQIAAGVQEGKTLTINQAVAEASAQPRPASQLPQEAEPGIEDATDATAQPRPASQLPQEAEPGIEDTTDATAQPRPASQLSQEAEPGIEDTTDATAQTRPASQLSQEAEPGTEDTTDATAQPAPSSDMEPQPTATSPDYGTMTPHEAFAVAVEELKTLIKAEFSALRAEIRMWREGQ